MGSKHENGDTLVEVLMAVVILGLVIVGAITIMNRGLAAAQIALEHSETRLEINRQIELLRYLRDQYAINPSSAEAALWSSVITGSNTNDFVYDTACQQTPAKVGTSFYLSRASGTLQKLAYNAAAIPQSSAKADTGGLWVEARPSLATYSPAYVDFVVRACWQASGSSGGTQRSVTAVRLYDPRPRP